MSHIHINHLTKRFGDVSVIEDLSLTVEDKDFLVLLGPSGCGKSTLLGIIAGFEDVTTGSIDIDGRNVAGLEPKDRGLSMVFQSYALYPTMSVRQNMSFGLRVAGMPAAQITARVERAASMLKMTPLLDRKPSQLSGGQRQRVAIGRALVRDVGLFLFDEPLSNLDAKLRNEMRNEIRRLHDTLGVTSIYVTHDQVEAMTMATKIAVMKDGMVQQHADPQTLYDAPANLFVAGFIGASPMNFFHGVLEHSVGRWQARCISSDLHSAIVPLNEYAFRTTPAVGQEVVLGIRPENLWLAGGAEGTPVEGLSTQLDQIEPMGSDTLVWLLFGEQRVSIRMIPREALVMRGHSGRIPLALDLHRLSVFDPKTERRL